MHYQIDFSPYNKEAICDEHGERFHQQIPAIESGYRSQWDVGILADHC